MFWVFVAFIPRLVILIENSDAAPASLFHQKAKAVCVSKFCDAVEVGHQSVRMVLFRPGEEVIKRWANGRRVGIENRHIEPL